MCLVKRYMMWPHSEVHSLNDLFEYLRILGSTCMTSRFRQTDKKGKQNKVNAPSVLVRCDLCTAPQMRTIERIIETTIMPHPNYSTRRNLKTVPWAPGYFFVAKLRLWAAKPRSRSFAALLRKKALWHPGYENGGFTLKTHQLVSVSTHRDASLRHTRNLS